MTPVFSHPLNLHPHAISPMDLSPSQQSFREALTANLAASWLPLQTIWPLMDLPEPSLLGASLALLIDLKKAKATHTHEKPACFILNDLGVPLNSLAAAFVAPHLHMPTS